MKVAAIKQYSILTHIAKYRDIFRTAYLKNRHND